MFEYHGWVNIVAYDLDDADPGVLNERQNELCLELEERFSVIQRGNIYFALIRGINGQDHFLVTGFNNHRQSDIIELFHWIAENQPYSYGLLHIRDDEDTNGLDNSIQVLSVARSKVIKSTETLLSPCIPKIEPAWK